MSSSLYFPALGPDSILVPDGLSPSTTLSLDDFSRDPGFLASQEELRSLIFNTAQSAAPSREGSPLERSRGSTAGPVQQIEQILSRGRNLEYLRNYSSQVAPWLDMFDSNRVFGIQLLTYAQNAPALLYALLALSARHLERKEGTKTFFDSLELYQHTIKLLTPLMQTRDPQCLPICVILCCLEMMSASPHDWRRHLDGCAALFDAFGVHGFSGGLDQALFWCYARMDLCGAFISDGTQSTLIPPLKWLPPLHASSQRREARDLFHEARSPDMHANYAVYLCAKICELMSDRTQYVELGEDNGCTKENFTRRWVQLWEELQSWRLERPNELLAIQTIDSKPFPDILFAHWAAISSNQLYHTGCILLLNCRPKVIEPVQDKIGSTTWHAKQICGISLTNPHQGCLANAIQPLWIAGRLLTHRSEQELIVKVIQGIETSTGWGSSWRIADLESAWGRKVR